MLKEPIRYILRKFGYEIRTIASLTPRPQTGLYRPLYSPWEAESFREYFAVAEPRTLVSRDRCYVLERLLRQVLDVPGDVFECGVYRGGTAALLRKVLRESGTSKRLFLFDTFAGMPATDAQKDWHKEGDFADTSLEEVKSYVGADDTCVFVQGFIPDTFVAFDGAKIAFCHVDLDIYKSITDCMTFVWPRVSPGGVVVFDDYGFPTCPGAREAVDDFFRDKRSVPLCLQTGQAIVFKNRSD